MENNRLVNGYKTEEQFVLDCIDKNIIISRPIFNIEPYDFIIEKDNKLYRVQVRKSWIDKEGRNLACLKTSYPRSNKINLTTQNDRIDFVAIYTESKDWYIIPRKAIQHLKSNISVSKNGNYGKYYNNFNFDLSV